MSNEPKAPRIAALLAQLRKFIAGVIAFNQRVAEEFNLNPSDMQIFEILEATGEATPTQLARQTGLTTGGVTTVLDRLESARLIQREPNPRDRRSVLVRATPEGLALLRPIYGKMNEDLEHQLALYNVKNLDVLIRFLEQANRIRGRRTLI
jgi:DNA-binding MarR family transcriptional regulator